MTTPTETPETVRQKPRPSETGAPPSAIITREGERVLRAELARLRHELESGSERLREARAFGAPTDNDDYLQIQEEEVILAVRAARLEELLARAQVVDGGAADGCAAVGTIVEVRDVNSGALMQYRLVGGHEPPRANAASAASPLGQALIGQVAGSIVVVHPPKGESQSLEIVRVLPDEQAQD